VERLRRRHDVIYSREPGGTPVGERIRALLLDDAHPEIAPQAEMLLFAASRAQFVAEVVEPALSQGRLVVSERYVDASLAYQGYARGLGMDVVRRVNEVATRGILPDLTVMLDIEPALGVERARHTLGKEGRQGRGDRLEQEDVAFFQRVREGFLKIATEERARVRLIDGGRTPEAVHADVVRVVDELLTVRGWGT
jgi:dTMP kinase